MIQRCLLLFPNFLITYWLTDLLTLAISRGAFAPKNHAEEINCQKKEVNKLQKLLLDANDSVKSNDREISKLTEMLNKDENELKVKDGAYQELETLVSEEGNTLQQVEKEMRNFWTLLLKIKKLSWANIE